MLRIGHTADAISTPCAKNAVLSYGQHLFFRLRAILSCLCAYPPHFPLKYYYTNPNSFKYSVEA